MYTDMFNDVPNGGIAPKRIEPWKATRAYCSNYIRTKRSRNTVDRIGRKTRISDVGLVKKMAGRIGSEPERTLDRASDSGTRTEPEGLN